jgi:hypothetical protein
VIVMVEASTHTIQHLWARARLLLEGDELNRAFSGGMLEVLRVLGATDPAAGQSPIQVKDQK